MTDKTDRELLELAAKAAGIDAEWHCSRDEVDEHADYLASTEGMWLKGERSPDNSKYWNPLRDDGDCFRLAHKLGLLSDVSVWPKDIAEARRCIVRAAASIGAKEQS